MEKEKNITQEQVLLAIKNNLEKNRKMTMDFEKEVYSGLKEDFEKLQEIGEKNNE